MKLENAPADNDQVQALVKSGDAVAAQPEGDASVTECPLKKKQREETPKKTKPPLRLLLWNIQEFGGGFYRPHQRPDYEIQSYAGILNKLEIDIAVIMGLTDTIGVVPKASKDFVDFDEKLKDTGPAEAQRLLQALGGTWKAEFPKPKAGKEKHLYHYRTTTCILWNTTNSISLDSSGIADSQQARDLGLTGKLFCGTFSAPKNTDSKVFVVAPLGTMVPEREWAVPPPPARTEAVAATIKKMPDIAAIAISAPTDLASSSDFASFKAQMDAQYRAPGGDGTLLNDQWWFPRVDSDDGVLDNFAGVDPGDSLLQDAEMHWEGLDEPEYAQDLEKVKGKLTDIWLLKNSGSEAPPQIEELRVVDLIAAALKTDVLGKVRPVKPENSKEDSAIAAQRDSYRKEMGTDQWKDDPVNQISDSAHFSSLLSNHWPVIMQLRYKE
jgi:hypothetical protein